MQTELSKIVQNSDKVKFSVRKKRISKKCTGEILLSPPCDYLSFTPMRIIKHFFQDAF